MAASGYIGGASVFTAIALLLTALGFATDFWLHNVVARDNLKVSTDSEISQYINSRKNYFTRHQGLFRECFTGNETDFLDNLDTVDGYCLLIDLRWTETVGSALESDNLWARIHLLRAWIVFLGLSLLFLLVGCIIGAVACWKISEATARGAGFLVFVAAFFLAGAMAFFHGAEYLEKNVIEDSAKWDIYNLWPAELQVNTRRSYGWSYIVSWAGFACAAIGGILYLIAAAKISEKKWREKRPTHVYDNYNGAKYPPPPAGDFHNIREDYNYPTGGSGHYPAAITGPPATAYPAVTGSTYPPPKGYETYDHRDGGWSWQRY